MPKAKSSEGVLALDLGTSSVRAVVYDDHGALVDATMSDLPYKVRTADAGEVSSDPDALVKLIAQSIDGALKAAHKEKVTILAVGVSCYWHSLMGVDRAGRPTTELLTWADTRSAQETRGMRTQFDERAYHARTGCFFHASYWPAKLRWLRDTRRAAVRRTARCAPPRAPRPPPRRCASHRTLDLAGRIPLPGVPRRRPRQPLDRLRHRPARCPSLPVGPRRAATGRNHGRPSVAAERLGSAGWLVAAELCPTLAGAA